jgi:hypothetical protein
MRSRTAAQRPASVVVARTLIKNLPRDDGLDREAMLQRREFPEGGCVQLGFTRVRDVLCHYALKPAIRSFG